jgi:DNA-binding CsgD family transcriptional regulator
LLTRAGGTELAYLPARWKPAGYELLTRCWLALGRRDDAAGAARQARASAAAVPLPTMTAMAERVEAAIALDGRNASAAERLARSAAAAFETAGALLDGAVARLVLADALICCGKQPLAAAELVSLAARLADTDVAGPRREAERRISMLEPHRAGRPRPAERDGALGALTEREHQVARLMASGRSNRQFAAELFLSPKTVETHLHNVFHKLGVTSRVEAARIVDRHDRPPGSLPG